MIGQGISAAQFRAMLGHVAHRIEESESRLNALDAAIGDGDHGITMRLGFAAIEQHLSTLSEDASITEILQESGAVFMDATGGAIGVILGRMLMAGGKGLDHVEAFGTAELKSLLVAMESGGMKAGKAQLGDKTILDALHGAIEAFSRFPKTNCLTRAFERAAEAAEVAAERTASMPSRVGRASRLGDRSLGHPDPGAVSFAIILRAMTEWMQQTS